MKLFLPFFPLIRDLQFFGKKTGSLTHLQVYSGSFIKQIIQTEPCGLFRNDNHVTSQCLKHFLQALEKIFFLTQVEMVFLGTPNLSAASLSIMPFSMCDRMSHFSFKVFVSSLRLEDIFVSTTLRTTNRLFFHLRSKFLF